jgi:molybdopterin synthase sulfur carrier subunit
MLVKVRSFAGFRNILGKEMEIELAEGARVVDLLNALCSLKANLGPQLFDDAGLREDVNIFVGGKNIASLELLRTVLSAGDEVALFPAAIGG